MATNILVALAVILHLAIAVVLVRKYLRTRDVGFIWLGVAVVIWPLISRLLERGEIVFLDRFLHGQLFGLWPFTLVERGQMTVGSLVLYLNSFHQVISICLLLVAVLYLSRTKSNSSLPPLISN